VEAVHPDDRAELRSAMAQVASGEAGRLRLELRMSVDATWRWLEATLLVIERDADGTPVRLLATLSDVDERHDAQSASGCRSACSSTCTKAC
jgi:PAS domain-containing protein